MDGRAPTFLCRRVDGALIFVGGTTIDGDQLAAFVEEFRSSHPSYADATLWPAAALESAFRRTFGVPVAVRRYAFDPSAPGVAFHIRAVDEQWQERRAG